ncbi:hypothetical protein L1N85_14385 [Paenibacillus alkaliterrae]|uniref:hypothetical protein n=1 Tax=Paenibacillus alkaliterrae TaxID=320909 RepID=UPI001F20D63A|nr:hypothetical protein [Paenibacillus alkaliterrae]MCF2939608.1 hypothetical protein [Paenibacillus alkaliterrae]
MKPMTAKELEYIADSMSNEELLIKQCTALAVTGTTPALQNLSLQFLQTHQNHYDSLLHAIQHHQQMAPTQPQQ